MMKTTKKAITIILCLATISTMSMPVLAQETSSDICNVFFSNTYLSEVEHNFSIPTTDDCCRSIDENLRASARCPQHGAERKSRHIYGYRYSTHNIFIPGGNITVTCTITTVVYEITFKCGSSTCNEYEFGNATHSVSMQLH